LEEATSMLSSFQASFAENEDQPMKKKSSSLVKALVA